MLNLSQPQAAQRALHWEKKKKKRKEKVIPHDHKNPNSSIEQSLGEACQICVRLGYEPQRRVPDTTEWSLGVDPVQIDKTLEKCL